MAFILLFIYFIIPSFIHVVFLIIFQTVNAIASNHAAPNGEKIRFLKSLVMAAVAGGVEGLLVLQVPPLTSWGVWRVCGYSRY